DRSQTRTVPSPEADATRPPPGEKASASMPRWCPSSVAQGSPVSRSQSRISPPELPVAATWRLEGAAAPNTGTNGPSQPERAPGTRPTHRPRGSPPPPAPAVDPPPPGEKSPPRIFPSSGGGKGAPPRAGEAARGAKRRPPPPPPPAVLNPPAPVRGDTRVVGR